MEEKIIRLEKVLAKIDLFEKSECHFDELYELLKNEYRLENGENGTGTYNNNLRQTIQKQASSFLRVRQRRPVKGAPSEYYAFINNFRSDVHNEHTSLKFDQT